MSIQPKSENFRKAFKWISEEHNFNTGREVKGLIDEACLKFNLSPKEADFLLRALLEEKK